MIKIIDVQTGQEIIREYNDQESEEAKMLRAEWESNFLKETQKIAEDNAARQSARAKLSALGLTESEINALVGA